MLALKCTLLLSLSLMTTEAPLIAQSAHDNFSVILQDHVEGGQVDYRNLSKDNRLEAYLGELANTDPDRLPDDNARLAFWINVYNAYTLKIICDNYPLKTINDLHQGGILAKKTIWDSPFVVVNHKKLTLNTVEHKIIRPIFQQPLIHFALVCAAKSCPPLRSEAYEGDKLQSQLREQARVFLNDPKANRFDKQNRKAYLSKILDWYGGDFGKTKEDVLLAISGFLRAPLAPDIKENLSAWEVRFADYDWGLNETSPLP